MTGDNKSFVVDSHIESCVAPWVVPSTNQFPRTFFVIHKDPNNAIYHPSLLQLPIAGYTETSRSNQLPPTNDFALLGPAKCKSRSMVRDISICGATEPE